MALLGTIGVKLAADTARFQKDIQGAAAGMRSFGATAAKIAAGATVAFGALAVGIGSTIKALDVQRRAEIRLKAAAEGSRQALDPARLITLAGELQNLTGAADEATIATAGFLAGLDLNQQALEKLLPGIVSMGVVTGRSADRIARVMGSALQGSASSLAAYGLSLTDAEKETFKLADASGRAVLVAQVMTRTFGDAAKQMRQTASGAFGAMTGRIGDLQEAIGALFDSSLGDFFTDLENIIINVTNAINGMSDTSKKWAARLAAVAGIALGLVAGLAGMVATIALVLPGLIQMTATLKASATAMAILNLGLGGARILFAQLMTTILPVLAAFFAIAAAVGAIRRGLKGKFDVDFGEQIKEGLFLAEIQGALGLDNVEDKASVAADALGDAADATNKIGAAVDGANPPVKKLGVTAEQAAEALKKATVDFGQFASGFSRQAIGSGVEEVLDVDTGKFGLDFLEASKGAIGDLADTVQSGIDTLTRELAAAVSLDYSELVDAFDFSRELTAVAEKLGPAVTDQYKALAEEMLELGVSATQIAEDINAIRGVDKTQADSDAAASQTASNISRAGAMITNAMGEVGSTVANVAEGFKSGGIVGAIIAAIGELLKKLPTFTKIVDKSGVALNAFAEVFDPILQILEPTTDLLNFLVVLIGRIIGVLMRLDLGFNVLLSNVGWLGDLFNEVFKAVAGAFNKFIRAIAKFIGDKLKLKGLAKKFRQLTIDMSQFSDVVAEVPPIDLTGAESSFEGAAKAADKLSESMANAPSGFKVALRRFQATSVGTSANIQPTQPTPASPLGSGLSASNAITINITANDAKEVAAKVQEIVENAANANDGSSQGGGNPYATASATPFG